MMATSGDKEPFAFWERGDLRELPDEATPTHRSFDFALNVSPPRRVPTAEYLRLGLVWR